MFNQISSVENLYQAWLTARKGKRSRGDVADFGYHVEDRLFELSRELKEGSYRHGTYRTFYVHDPKRRLIAAAPFRDRVVHHAVMRILEPLLEARLIPTTFANRKGKGNHAALDACQIYCRRFDYVLQLDIRKFFPSISHTLLKPMLWKHVRDEQLLDLIEQILETGLKIQVESPPPHWFPGDNLFSPLEPMGLPIGNLTSQIWANYFLNDLDHFAKRSSGAEAFMRYMDDMLLFSDSKKTLWTARQRVMEKVGELRLCFHPGSHPRPVTEGIPFLGFIVFPEKRRMKNRKVRDFHRRFESQLVECLSGTGDWKMFQQRNRCWISHAAYANTVGLRKSVFRDAWPKAMEKKQRRESRMAIKAKRIEARNVVGSQINIPPEVKLPAVLKVLDGFESGDIEAEEIFADTVAGLQLWVGGKPESEEAWRREAEETVKEVKTVIETEHLPPDKALETSLAEVEKSLKAPLSKRIADHLSGLSTVMKAAAVSAGSGEQLAVRLGGLALKLTVLAAVLDKLL